jgi:hypothetical protein
MKKQVHAFNISLKEFCQKRLFSYKSYSVFFYLGSPRASPWDFWGMKADVVLRLSHHSSIHSELLPRQTKSEPLHNRQAAENQYCKDNEISPSLNRYPGRL